MDCRVLDFGLGVGKQTNESLDQVAVSEVLAVCFGKFRVRLRKAESNLPGLIFSSSEECSKSMHLVFFLTELGGDFNE